MILSSISGDQLNKLPSLKIPHLDKVAHFGMYFIFVILLKAGYKQIKKEAYSFYHDIYIIILAVLYGGFIEILQHFVFSKRSMDIYDFLANCLGIVMAVLLFPLLKRKSAK